jgi:hypothetical protein
MLHVYFSTLANSERKRRAFALAVAVATACPGMPLAGVGLPARRAVSFGGSDWLGGKKL